MDEQGKNNGTPAENDPTGTEDYVEALKKLRDTTVPKTEYEKLKGENKKLLDTLVNGGSINPEDAPGDKRTVEEIRKELFEGDCTNLQYWKNALALREKVMDEGGRDPFLPFAHDYVPTEEDIAASNRVVEAVTSCIEIADGDPDIFTNELQRITVDTVPRKR